MQFVPILMYSIPMDYWAKIAEGSSALISRVKSSIKTLRSKVRALSNTKNFFIDFFIHSYNFLSLVAVFVVNITFNIFSVIQLP